MPTAFQKELVTLAHRLADLGDLVAIALEEATRSVLESDHTLGGRVREQAAAAAALGAACEDQACALLALHAPREAEVKAVVAAVHIAADLTRMGGLAREVAGAPGPVPPEVRPAVGRLGGHAVAAARAVRAVLVDGDRAGLGAAVALVAEGVREVREWADGCAGPRGAGVAVELALLAAVHGRFAGIADRVGRLAVGFVPVRA
ncbi:PhoU domain-containing protein [Amycolatopsis sp.]|uniref:PhoU domain-containing protein n=1 Tax=Amycolatopsis sp. TaxID=37632 RepID=UPI002D7EF665|nr:PhoU domain-containing protein [Amycolatopsis sp.]HET6710954.1 PhoU domain-containing protein [Amycolatopsis sp.]